MILTGEYVFSGPRQTVWDLLQDPAVLVKAMPGAKKLDVTGDGVYEGVIRIGVGPVTAAEWRLTVVLSDKAEPESYSMQVDSKGPVGFTRGSARVELLSELTTTRMRYHADLQIGGKVAGVGQRLLDQVAKLLTKQGLEALSRELKARLAGGLHVSASASHTRFAADGTSGLGDGSPGLDADGAGSAGAAASADGAGDGSPGLDASGDEGRGGGDGSPGEGGAGGAGR